MEVSNMTVDTNTLVSITEANQNFSKVARLVDEHGTAVILKNNVTDISEPILEYLDAFTLDKSYKSLELSILETDALNKIRELLS